jgi:hypothetical protein
MHEANCTSAGRRRSTARPRLDANDLGDKLETNDRKAK